MIDTIKFLVPIIDDLVFQTIKSNCLEKRGKDLKTGETKYTFYSSQVNLGSYNKSINIFIEDSIYHKGLFIELSIPKNAKGNNIEMLLPSELPPIIEKLAQEITTHLATQLPHFSTWQIFRLDLCYNWIFKTKEETETVMGFLQRLNYPHKKKDIYNSTGVTFNGTAYIVKFYLKGPEFLVHDFKKLSEEEKTSDRTLSLIEWAQRIVRFEVGFKKKYVGDVFGYKKVFLEHVIDDEKIEEILKYYLNDKVFKYVTLKNIQESQVEEILYSNFSKRKATSLYRFYNDYVLESGAIKKRIDQGGVNRSTVWRYLNDLKKVGIGFHLLETNGSSLLEQLVIPSPNSKFDLLGFPENSPLGSLNKKVV